MHWNITQNVHTQVYLSSHVNKFVLIPLEVSPVHVIVVGFLTRMDTRVTILTNANAPMTPYIRAKSQNVKMLVCQFL